MKNNNCHFTEIPNEDLEIISYLDEAQILATCFEHSIKRNVFLVISPVIHDNHKFSLDYKVTLNFLQKYLVSSVPGLKCDAEMEEWQRSTCDIGKAFDCFYHELMVCAKPLFEFSRNPDCSDEVTNLISDLNVLSSAMDLLENPYKLDYNYMETLSQSLSSLSMYKVFSDREIYKKGDKTCYLCECDNLFQVCFSILDFLCHFSHIDQYGSRTAKLSLHRCAFCNRFFIAANRRKKYCSYKDKNGFLCSEKAESIRKRKYSLREKTVAEKLADEISHRLYSFRNSLEYSRQDRMDGAEYQKRTDLYNLFMVCKSKHSTQPDYQEWLIEAESLLPKSRSESYDKFYEWLLERG